MPSPKQSVDNSQSVLVIATLCSVIVVLTQLLYSGYRVRIAANQHHCELVRPAN